MIRLGVIRDNRIWDQLVFKAWFKTPDHIWLNGNTHIYADVHVENLRYIMLLPGYTQKLLGHECFVSFGLRRSGGPAIIVDYPDSELFRKRLIETLPQALQMLIEALLTTTSFSCVNLTIKTYLNPVLTYAFLKAVDSLARRWSIKVAALKARILPMKGLDLNELWTRRYNKKVRNAVRRFKRNGCTVLRLDNPLKYVDETMEINLSSPVRQGKPLPRSYTDARLVLNHLKLAQELYGRNGVFRVYAAYKGDTMVGYSYVFRLGGHAYISRFLMHAMYTRVCPGEGLLHHILEDLLQEGATSVVQYGYWSPRSSPGIDHFLKQFGFEVGYELTLYVAKHRIEPCLLMARVKSLVDRLYVPARIWRSLAPIRRVIWSRIGRQV